MTPRYRTLSRFAIFLLPALLLPVFLGCGGSGGDDVIATVGDREITAGYYTARLARLQPQDIPRNEDGEFVDTATLEGKRAFLDVIVNKELMVCKALDLGYDRQEQVQGAHEAVLAFRAPEIMREDLIKAPSMEVTEAEIQEYYELRSQIRHFHFLICNFEKDAAAARQALLDGALWEDVADEYNDGSRGPNDDYTMKYQYGMGLDTFERALMAVEKGQISQPIESYYGYWIVRLDEIEPTRIEPLDDTFRQRIEQTIVGKKTQIAEQTFLEESRERHGFTFDETSLWLIFQALPEEEPYLNPETGKPYPKGELTPLVLPIEELDRPFMSYRNDEGEVQSWTLGEYQNLYNNMSVFQRPKKNLMLGGVKRKIIGDMVDRYVMIFEARERGYFADPRVTEQATEQSEQQMLTLFHDEVVKYEEFVDEAAMRAFYAENMDRFKTVEERSGHLVVCKDEATAQTALQALREGDAWSRVFRAYNAVADESGNEGAVRIRTDAQSPERAVLWSLGAAGDLSEPFAARNGWCVLRLDEIFPSRQQEFGEITGQLSEFVKRDRQDKALKALLAQWREDYPVTINEDALAAAPSWEALQNAQ